MWFIFALTASALWGFSYVLNEQIYKYTSIYTLLAIDSLIIGTVFLILALLKGVFHVDIATIASTPKVFWYVVAGLVVFALAEFFIALSITSKNATLAGLVEISYPLFTALFAYLLFKENQVNLGILCGALLIFIGVGIVYYFSET